MPPYHTTTLLHGIRALTGGLPGAPIVVLIPGWPQTAEAFTPLFEPLSQKYRFYALDPPGLGDSAPPTNSTGTGTDYSTVNVSRLMASAIHATLEEGQKYHLLGHDIGGWIAYPWAAQFQSRVKSLSILDASVPGFMHRLNVPQQFPLPTKANQRLWQFSFNALPDLPEILTRGREGEMLAWFFNLKTVQKRAIGEGRFQGYIQSYSRPSAMSRGFEYYRAFEESAAQNVEFAESKLEIPVLGLGGEGSVGGGMVNLVKGFADNVEGGVIEECGHYLPEEQPDFVAERVLEFWGRVERE
ncbi:alpha/beta-hydrolase [Aspergillus nidulans var. acristatus]